MPITGWKQLLAGFPWFQREGSYPIAAYSEFMPPPRVGRKPYDGIDTLLFDEKDLSGWHVTEYEEAFELRPGLNTLAHQIFGALVHLGKGTSAHGIARNKLVNNPYWPTELAEHAGKLPHERYVVLLPLALSRTQDDKGRVRWTFFGGSEHGPSVAFWKGFFTGPGIEVPEEKALDFFRRLLAEAYGEPFSNMADLHGCGFRILTDKQCEGDNKFPWPEGPLPSWVHKFAWSEAEPPNASKYLLTFAPFTRLPEKIRHAYLAGELHLLPFPGSLLFWGLEHYMRLQEELPLATQIPLLNLTVRHEGWYCVRVLQSGWFSTKENHNGESHHHGPIRNTYKRTHRWARVYRHEDELSVIAREDPLLHVLFSVLPDDVRLYGKPMARNVQLWDHDFHLLLDGPRASLKEIEHAAGIVCADKGFGYRFLFPAMRAGCHEVYWHRPLVAYSPGEGKDPLVIHDAPLGYLTAYRLKESRKSEKIADTTNPLELWPRLLKREFHLAALELRDHKNDLHPNQTTLNVRKLLDTRRLLGGRPLPVSFARSILTLPKHVTLHDWLACLTKHDCDTQRCEHLVAELQSGLEPATPSSPSVRPRSPDHGRTSHGQETVAQLEALTFHHTAKRSFEVAYWKHIAELAEGRYLNKNNADCVYDPVTRLALDHPRRDLHILGDHLLAYYTRVIAATKMKGKALAGDLPFHWRSEFDYPWFGGWTDNQEGTDLERNLIVVIPGRDRRRAVIMADHYDTAYMEDIYEKDRGGSGARLAAAGADDNHSATVAMMMGAPVFLELSKAGKLACDIWLIHLTGEEFPADCLGARNLCQSLVEGNLKMRLPSGDKSPSKWRDLSKVRVQGVYVLDMVAHNNDNDPDIFQMSPGASSQSMELAYQAHIANEIWNASVPGWNARPARNGCKRGRRSPNGKTIPATALHPHLEGQVRPPYDPRSVLYNTDGQIFSDCGIPVVLFMENYDINRTGYHDTHDTMENIDLDYGAAVSAIAIESVARAAAFIEKQNKQ